MRKIIDSSFMQEPELEKYLQKSENNHAVLTDYAYMEASKSDDITSIYQSLSVVSKFPRQVLILKTTPKVCELIGRSSGMPRKMIDSKHTELFRKSCYDWQHPEQSLSLKGQVSDLRKRRDAVRAQLDIILGRARDLTPMINDVAEFYTKEELSIIRQPSKEYTPSIIRKMLFGARLYTDEFLKSYPHIKKYSNDRELINTFIFRHSLCSHLFMVRWLSVGGPINTLPEKIRNDMVDIYFATYGTFFDGILTRDTKLQNLHEEARFIISRIRT